MKLPCELVVWYVLPSIRSELTRELIKLGMSQKEVSKKLGITQAAVSQYVSKKRGYGIKFKKDVIEAIRKLAKDIVKDNTFEDLTIRTCNICMKIKADKTLCKLHRDYEEIPKDCNACLNSR